MTGWNHVGAEPPAVEALLLQDVSLRNLSSTVIGSVVHHHAARLDLPLTGTFIHADDTDSKWHLTFIKSSVLVQRFSTGGSGAALWAVCLGPWTHCSTSLTSLPNMLESELPFFFLCHDCPMRRGGSWMLHTGPVSSAWQKLFKIFLKNV